MIYDYIIRPILVHYLGEPLLFKLVAIESALDAATGPPKE